MNPSHSALFSAFCIFQKKKKNFWEGNYVGFVVAVLASGVWLAPGDSEEVASALSQALRNRIERYVLY